MWTDGGFADRHSRAMIQAKETTSCFAGIATPEVFAIRYTGSNNRLLKKGLATDGRGYTRIEN